MFRKMNGSMLGSRETIADIWVYNSLSGCVGLNWDTAVKLKI